MCWVACLARIGSNHTVLRTWDSEAIILKTWPIGEIHLGIGLLTRDRGLVQAIAHGARSAHGSLRSACQGFNQGRAFLYQDPVKQSLKIKEFIVSEQYVVLKSQFSKLMHAAVWAELLLKVHQDSAWEFELMQAVLTMLETQASIAPRIAVNDMVVRTSVLFFWKHLEMSGICPDPAVHAGTGYAISRDSWTMLSMIEGGFIPIAEQQEGDRHTWKEPLISPGARQWLIRAATVPFEESVGVGLAINDMKILLHALLLFAQAHFNVKLAAIDYIPLA